MRLSLFLTQVSDVWQIKWFEELFRAGGNQFSGLQGFAWSSSGSVHKTKLFMILEITMKAHEAIDTSDSVKAHVNDHASSSNIRFAKHNSR